MEKTIWHSENSNYLKSSKLFRVTMLAGEITFLHSECQRLKLRRVFILDCLLAEIVTVCGHKLCKGIYRIKLGKKQELFFFSLTSLSSRSGRLQSYGVTPSSLKANEVTEDFGLIGLLHGMA
jgi:hypothetical protein